MYLELDNSEMYLCHQWIECLNKGKIKYVTEHGRGQLAETALHQWEYKLLLFKFVVETLHSVTNWTIGV